jgi:tetrapyrrole methylase family protein/MazG family protein/ATP diphosphatase
MAQLRDPESGCPWDREQRFETIAPYTIEEAYEVADAIERGATTELKDELGDLLFQVVFHARLAEEAGAFSFDDVEQAICDKLTRRHPHVFGNVQVETAEAQTAAWETMKAQERPHGSSVLADIPLGLPALTRAAKLGRRASRVGYDWPDISGARHKVAEELAELDEAVAAVDPERIESEMGDVFFALVNVCRHLNVDPESVTRGANHRFQGRFEFIERAVRQSGRPWPSFSLEELEALWSEAKAQGL